VEILTEKQFSEGKERRRIAKNGQVLIEIL
jgi:hypothetical protein